MSFLSSPDPSSHPKGGAPLLPGTENCAEALTLLSGREGEIVLHAVDGCTDEQIAQRLGISASTVNSYWVRIRGKVGPLSRTEIVGLVLRHEARRNSAEMMAENAVLLEECERTKAELAVARAELRASRDASWHLAALCHVPEAILVFVAPGAVLYANPAAKRLFSADAEEMEGLSLDELSLVDEASRAEVARLFESEGAATVALGWDRPWHGRRRDGSSFRGVFKAERSEGARGTMVVATVREIGADMDALVASLRRPFVGG